YLATSSRPPPRRLRAGADDGAWPTDVSDGVVSVGVCPCAYRSMARNSCLRRSYTRIQGANGGGSQGGTPTCPVPTRLRMDAWRLGPAAPFHLVSAGDVARHTAWPAWTNARIRGTDEDWGGKRGYPSLPQGRNTGAGRQRSADPKPARPAPGRGGEAASRNTS